MSDIITLGRFSLGVGDRFAHQARAQLRACVLAAEQGVQVVPVWNKSQREHQIIGSEPAHVRAAAEAAVKALGWDGPFHVDADHVNLNTVDRFVPYCDFFTIDVADFIGKPATEAALKKFTAQHGELIGKIEIPGTAQPFQTTHDKVARIASKYLLAIGEAAKAYRHIAQAKGSSGFITEISMDETEVPQAPPELLVILAAIADEGIPLQTIAPKFTGRFNKGVDYAGDVEKFEQEFSDHLRVIAFAVKQYGLPPNLKLSVHSGSDKFSLYPVIRRALTRQNAGVHVKTAGTTWLEEIVGLASSGGEGLAVAKAIYSEALAHMEEFCAPYAAVIDIDRAKLPPVSTVANWNSEQFVTALRHEPHCPQFNPHVRQLLHVGYKVAAKMGRRYLDQVEACEKEISKNVTANLFERHIRPLFLE